MRIDRTLISALLVMVISACAVGPNFKPPAAPKVSGYTASPLATTPDTPNVLGGNAQHFVAGADISADWWTLFHSEPLNELIEQSLANNHDLKAAQAALSVARENVLAQRGVYYPSVAAELFRQPPAAIGHDRADAQLTTPSCTTFSRRR